jgi:hypothetical protein
MSECDFSSGLVCPACGYRARHANTHRICRPPVEPPPVMLGDLVAAWLERIGITKAAVSAIVGRDCGCAGRQSWLNDFGAKVQLAAGRAVRAAARFYGLG